MTLQDLQAKIKAASDKMRADDNTKNALRYLEQLTWLLFLKQWDTIEHEREMIASVDGQTYQHVIEGDYRWSAWTKSGRTGDELVKWISEDLLPYLRELGGSPQADQIARLFEAVGTVMKSGYSLAEVVGIVDTIDLHAIEEHHAMSVIYETLLAQTADAGWSGEFYTPRPVVELMVELVNPRIGETIYDPCSGSGGFLVSAAMHLRPQVSSTADELMLTRKSIFGQEAGDLAFFVGTMNLMLHGIDDPQTIRRNTLEQDIRNIDPSEQHKVILTNPPFGGTENPQVQQNFPARAAATELLFLQHCMGKLADGGRCAIVIPDGILYRTIQAYSTVRRRLLTEFAVTGVVRLPLGVFPTAADTRTNILLFERGIQQPKTVRYYQVLPPAGKSMYSKTNPLPAAALEPVKAWIRDGIADDQSWEVSVEDVKQTGWALDIPWPGAGAVADGSDAPERLSELEHGADTIRDIAKQLLALAESVDDFETTAANALAGKVEERGVRAGMTQPERFVGVSNEGGLGAFKGKPAADTSRYRRLEIGDFVYNPMRVNVGSIALCRRAEEEGWVSPDYVVFRLKDTAPFSAEYLLTFMKSANGKAEITRRSRGAVRRRLYYENLEEVHVPIPADPEAWEAVLQGLASARRHVRDLPRLGAQGLSALEQALFAQPEGDDQVVDHADVSGSVQADITSAVV
jgi:type I restriction enzyme M protein